MAAIFFERASLGLIKWNHAVASNCLLCSNWHLSNSYCIVSSAAEEKVEDALLLSHKYVSNIFLVSFFFSLSLSLMTMCHSLPHEISCVKK